MRRFRLVWSALVIGAGMALVFGLLGSSVGAEDNPAPTADPAGGEAWTVVADHLNNPRQIAVDGRTLYVAEAGTGGDQCIGEGEDQTCIGFTGSVTRVRDDRVRRVQTGLLSIGSPEGDVVGIDAVALKRGALFGVMTSTCAVPLDSLPPEVTAQLGKVLHLFGGTDQIAVGDPGSFECQNDPDGQGPDSDPYGIAARGKTLYVADAAGNDIVSVLEGNTSLETVLSTDSQPVPTSLAFGPDGALYIGTLNFEAGPGGAAVYRYDPETGDLSVYASGLTAVTSLAFGHGGTLYVTEWTTGFGPDGPLPDGDVVAIPWGGGTDGRQVIGTGTLHFPTGVAVIGSKLYVSNWGIATGEDGPFGPGAHGQLVMTSLEPSN
jgi:hypothetical protein